MSHAFGKVGFSKKGIYPINDSKLIPKGWIFLIKADDSSPSIEEYFPTPDEMNEKYFDDFVESDEVEPSSSDFTDAELSDEVRKSGVVEDLKVKFILL